MTSSVCRFSILAAGAGLALSLAGCGKSTEAQREKIVRCTGFSSALVDASDDPTFKAAGQILISKYNVTDQDTVPMGAASRSYAATMDPAKVSQLTDLGKADASGLLGKKDADGIAGYTKSCVDTYHALSNK